MKWFLYLLAVPFGLLTFFGIAQGEGPQVERDLDKIVAQIHATYDKIDDLQSNFVQTVEIFDFNVPYVSKGRLFIKKGKMRWDYNEPSRQQIFVDGKGFHYYVPEHKQVIRSRVGGHSDSHLPLQLLAGRGDLNQDFHISFEGGAPSPGSPIALRLVPKKRMGLIKIVITIFPSQQIKGLMIQKAVLYEENGNVSTSTFDGIKVNNGLEDDLFVFKIPKGVEVLDAP